MVDQTRFLQGLNEEQRRVVEEGDGYCLVLAGAGSGKTKTVTHRVAYLIAQGVDPSTILLLTFTNKAAKEMLSRVQVLVGEAAHRVVGGTFHSCAHRLLRQFRPGYRLTILDQDDAKDLLGLAQKNVPFSKEGKKRLPSSSHLLSLISYAKNSARPLEEVLEERLADARDVHGWCLQVALAYEARKQQNGVADFDDLLLHWLAFLQTIPEDHPLKSRFHYVFVDEYQDTNALQARIVEQMSRAHKQLLVVGDDAQSIYSFRAATIDHILAFPKQFPDARQFQLTKNYRSTPQILALANESIQHNIDQFEKTLQAVRPNGSLPHVVRLLSSRAEAQYVVRMIKDAVAKGQSASEIAVLFRAAFHSQALEFELIKHGIAYDYRGGMKFFERAHIKDLLASVRLFENVHDEVAWVRTLKRLPGIGATGAAQIASFAVTFPDLTAVCESAHLLKLSAKTRVSWQGLIDLLKRLIPSADRPGDLIRALIDGGYREYVLLEYPDGTDRLEDLSELALFADPYRSLNLFLEDVSLTESGVESTQEAGKSGVVLSTIHQAKGLEWSRVFLIHASEGRFPNPRSFEDRSALEEERRLFYVAVTRAADDLTILAPTSFGTPPFESNGVSLFIEELPSRLFEEEEIWNDAPKRRNFSEDDGETTIIVSELGEYLPPAPKIRSSLLRSIDEL